MLPLQVLRIGRRRARGCRASRARDHARIGERRIAAGGDDDLGAAGIVPELLIVATPPITMDAQG